jgi:hypothetical protein
MKERLKQATRYYELKKFYQKYERALIPSMLVIGVLADFITFRTISIKSAFILLGIHLIVSGSIIAYVNYYDSRRIETKSSFYRYLRLASPLIIQFSFGALLSASLIFYWFSGVLSVSWPFMALIALLIVSNDVFREYYLKPVVQIGVYFFVLFSIFSLIVPFLFNSISVWIFLLSGAMSLIVITLYIKLLSKYLIHVRSQKTRLAYAVAFVYIFMNALYFLNIIPPIPLSLREAGVYHDLERTAEGYTVLAEGESVLQKLIPGQTIHTQEGSPIYVYSAIFAPADLNTTIVHHWQYYDEAERKWVSKDELSFFISGGSESGYRGYSVKTSVAEGRWRIDVETKRGQVLGRIPIRIKYVEELPVLKEEMK